MSRIPSIPQSLKAWVDGLEEIDIGNQAFVVIEEDHFFDNSFQSSMVDTLKCIGSSLSMELNALSMDFTQVNVFRYLIDPVLPFLAHCTSQELVKKGKNPISLDVMFESIGTLVLRAGFNNSAVKAWERMDQISNGFSVMDKSRSDVIFESLRGFDVVSRPPSKSDDSWLHRYDVFYLNSNK